MPDKQKIVGRITRNVKELVNGIPAEIEYVDEERNIVGYWAYGSFDPSLPYQGEEKKCQ